jgi:hypothetical protein
MSRSSPCGSVKRLRTTLETRCCCRTMMVKAWSEFPSLLTRRSGIPPKSRGVRALSVGEHLFHRLFASRLIPEPIAVEALAPVDTREVLDLVHEGSVSPLVRERVDIVVVRVRTIRSSHDAPALVTALVGHSVLAHQLSHRPPPFHRQISESRSFPHRPDGRFGPGQFRWRDHCLRSFRRRQLNPTPRGAS